MEWEQVNRGAVEGQVTVVRENGVIAGQEGVAACGR